MNVSNTEIQELPKLFEEYVVDTYVVTQQMHNDKIRHNVY